MDWIKHDKRVLTSDGYKKVSQDTNAKTVIFDEDNSTLEDRITELSSDLNQKPSISEGGYFNTLADFWTEYTRITSSNRQIAFIRFKDEGGWTGNGGGWVRAYVTSQNRLGNGSWDVGGNILLHTGAETWYIGVVIGGKTDTSDLAVTWSRISLDGHTHDYLSLTGGMLTGAVSTETIAPRSANTYSIGTTDLPYKYLYTNRLYSYSSGAQYGLLFAAKTGTTDTDGIGRLLLGNNIASGTAGNALGQIYMYGTNTGYTSLTPNNNTTKNIDIKLPSTAGTLALTSNLSDYLPLAGGTMTGHILWKFASGGELGLTKQSNNKAFAFYYKKNGGSSWTNTLFSIVENSDGTNVSNYFNGELSGNVVSSLGTGTHLKGNQGTAIINSTVAAGYNMLARMKSTNGVFTMGMHNADYKLQYTADSVISAGTNSVSKTAVLLNEAGNSSFPGTVTAPTFSGSLSGHATSAGQLGATANQNCLAIRGYSGTPTSSQGFMFVQMDCANNCVNVGINGAGAVGVNKAKSADAASVAYTLGTARNFQVNLGSTSAASFNASANCAPGVYGTLGVGNGGTGVTTYIDLLKKLFTTNGTTQYIATFAQNYASPGFATPQQIRNAMGLGNTTGAVPVANGGTGATTAANARTNLGLGAAATYGVTTSATSGSTALITSGAVYSGLAGKANSSHTHSYLPLTGGTLTGQLTTSNGIIASTQQLTLKATTGNLMCYGAAAGFYKPNTTTGITVYAGAFTQTSSKRYKENIVSMSEEDAMKLLALNPVKYDYINKDQGTDCYGLIAEEVAEIMEYPVIRDKENLPNGIDYSRFVPYLIKMVQIQQKEIEELKAKVG